MPLASRRSSSLSSVLLAGALVFAARVALAAPDGESAADVKAAGKTGERAPRAAPQPAAATQPAAPPAAGEGAAPDAKTWDISPYGYLRAGYEHVQTDARYDFVGRNNGFLLDAARVGVEGRNEAWHLTFRISAEGAADAQSGINTPQGSLEVRLRDAFARYDFAPWLGAQLGQFKAPFDAEELRGTQDLLFASRAVAQLGVLPGRGFQEEGIAIDRQLGLMLSSAKPIPIVGDLGASYYAMLFNGNGQNQALNDNNRLGIVGRIELTYGGYVALGGAALKNERTSGALPNLYAENDVGFDGDLAVRAFGFEAFAQIATIRSSYPTVGAADRVRLGYHAQLGYRIENPILPVAPAYRYAHYHPWQSGGDATTGQDYDAFKLDHHTFGVKVWHPSLPLVGWINYTLTMEPPARRLDNDRLEILGQVTF